MHGLYYQIHRAVYDFYYMHCKCNVYNTSCVCILCSVFVRVCVCVTCGVSVDCLDASSDIHGMNEVELNTRMIQNGFCMSKHLYFIKYDTLFSSKLTHTTCLPLK
jgi:hypothetical protein